MRNMQYLRLTGTGFWSVGTGHFYFFIVTTIIRSFIQSIIHSWIPAGHDMFELMSDECGHSNTHYRRGLWACMVRACVATGLLIDRTHFSRTDGDVLRICVPSCGSTKARRRIMAYSIDMSYHDRPHPIKYYRTQKKKRRIVHQFASYHMLYFSDLFHSADPLLLLSCTNTP